MIQKIILFSGKGWKTIPKPKLNLGQGKPILGGLKRKVSPCCGASIVTSGGTGVRRDICSKCRKSIHENRLR